MPTVSRIALTATTIGIGLALAGCGSSGTTTSSANPTPSATAPVSSLAVVCPKITAAIAALPDGSVSDQQIADFETQLNLWKAELPPAEQAPLTALSAAYKQLELANNAAAVTTAQAAVTAATEALGTACAK
ncbi:MAG: hypothetical protein WCI74_16440 [Actinomycetes bacterium]